jgi:hypothetical protein
MDGGSGLTSSILGSDKDSRFQVNPVMRYAMLDDRCVALFDFFDPHQSRQRKLIESWRDRAVSM